MKGKENIAKNKDTSPTPLDIARMTSMLTLKSYAQITSCTKICPELENNKLTGHPCIYSGMLFFVTFDKAFP